VLRTMPITMLLTLFFTCFFLIGETDSIKCNASCVFFNHYLNERVISDLLMFLSCFNFFLMQNLCKICKKFNFFCSHKYFVFAQIICIRPKYSIFCEFARKFKIFVCEQIFTKYSIYLFANQFIVQTQIICENSIKHVPRKRS
jgi:hypothetical protein